jgi:hypothetical protein
MSDCDAAVWGQAADKLAAAGWKAGDLQKPDAARMFGQEEFWMNAPYKLSLPDAYRFTSGITSAIAAAADGATLKAITPSSGGATTSRSTTPATQSTSNKRSAGGQESLGAYG